MSKRFAILNHFPPKRNSESHARTNLRHFDFMLENDQGTLTTFELFEMPLPDGTSIQVERIADHAIRYLGFEGPVSGNRGNVERFAYGIWEGELEGAFELRFDQSSASYSGECWKMEFEHPDHSPSAVVDSAGFSTEAGRFRSLKRLL